MYPDDLQAGSKSALGAFVIDELELSNLDLILAVATEVEFSIDWSEWRLISGEHDEWRLHTNGDCRFLVGELVVLDLAKRTLVPCFKRYLRFRILDVGKTSNGLEETS
jgi:hypothetical protein